MFIDPTSGDRVAESVEDCRELQRPDPAAPRPGRLHALPDDSARRGETLAAKFVAQLGPISALSLAAALDEAARP